MSFSFSSLLRLIVLMAVGSTILAVGISRLDPPKPGWRARRPANHVSINEYFLDVTDRTPRWLDVDTGRVTAHGPTDGDVLEVASCSPFVDDRGRRQVVGRWSSRTKDGPMSMTKDFGLARYTFPDGEMLEQISTETVPVGPPVWFPGTRARILFAAGDGQLYHYAFEAEHWLRDESEPAKGRDLRPHPLAWGCPKPGDGNVFIGDLAWPDDPRMGGRVVVSLREQEFSMDGARFYTRTQIWWLKLNHAGTEIVDAGRLVTPDRSGAAAGDFDERSPTVGALADGRPVLAYLRQRAGQNGWDLRLSPIRIDSDRHVPAAFESSTVPVTGGCQPAHPAFSSDGRWLSAIVGQSTSEGRVSRFKLSEALAAGPLLQAGASAPTPRP